MSAGATVGVGPVLVVGLGVSGVAVARVLRAEGVDVVAVDDRSSSEPDRGRLGELAEAEGVRLVDAGSAERLAAVVAGCREVVVSPGVPIGHRVFECARAAGVPVVSEIEMAWRRSGVPILAVTGTNGKTTVTTLVTAMLEASGIAAVAAGNIGVPLVSAVAQGAGAAGRPAVVVAEVSSFQLALTDGFAPRVAAWLNWSEDHLDWHPDTGHYRCSKARVWANLGPGDVAVANAEDPVVLAEASRALGLPAGGPDRPGPGPVQGSPTGATLVTFGLRSGDYHVEDGHLLAPGGIDLARVADMTRSLPHDLANAAAAAAIAMAAGATAAGCREALLEFRGLPHRVELVGEAGGVRWYDDSKATTPDAVLAALSGFDSAVLVAGGRNKGLHLGRLSEAAQRVRAVIAIGEAADEVAEAFSGLRPVEVAGSMEDAVDAAAAAARPGDVVLLSPGCASFDWYGSYAERGDDFARLARSRAGVSSAPARRPVAASGPRPAGGAR